MMDFLVYWGPTLVPVAVILLVFGFAMRRQAAFFKNQAQNSAAQTAELRKIGQSLDRVAAAIEKRVNTSL
jgi:hypothetical protein